MGLLLIWTVRERNESENGEIVDAARFRVADCSERGAYILGFTNRAEFFFILFRVGDKLPRFLFFGRSELPKRASAKEYQSEKSGSFVKLFFVAYDVAVAIGDPIDDLASGTSYARFFVRNRRDGGEC